MTKLSRKSILITTGGIVATCGVAVALFLTLQSSPASKNTTKTSGDTPAISILKAPEDYKNKNLTVHGTITELEIEGKKGYYIIAGEKGKTGALKLDFSKSNIDPTIYAHTKPRTTAPSEEESLEKREYDVVKGYLAPPSFGPPILEVQSVN